MTIGFAVITGGTRGLGESLVNRFWYAGFSLIVTARQEADIHKVLKGLPKRDDQKALAIPS